MRGLILAGGTGSRLRPLTHTHAKQLLPIANKPIIYFAIEDMVAAGISEIVIILGTTGPQVRESIGDGSSFGATITYVQQDAPLGLAHCVLIAEEALGSSPFFMFLGDNMFESDITTFVRQFELSMVTDRTFTAQLGVIKVSNPSSFGVAVLDDLANVVNVEEKPLHPKSKLALVGTYGFTGAIFDAVRAINPSARGELEITDAIQYLISCDRVVKAFEIEGWWKDTGNPESYLDCNRRVLCSLKTTLPLDSKITNATIIEPCAIASGVSIRNATIGPNVSIGKDVTIDGISIDNSVILENSSLLGSGQLRNSIIGRNCNISLSSIVTVGNVILGDDSYVDL